MHFLDSPNWVCTGALRISFTASFNLSRSSSWLSTSSSLKTRGAILFQHLMKVCAIVKAAGSAPVRPYEYSNTQQLLYLRKTHKGGGGPPNPQPIFWPNESYFGLKILKSVPKMNFLSQRLIFFNGPW